MEEDELESLYLGRLGLDSNYFWYELTPRQAFNILHGQSERRKEEFESHVFIHRKLHCHVLNLMAGKGKKVKEADYWPLEMDKNLPKRKRTSDKANSKGLDGDQFIKMFAQLGAGVKEG
jgi:hypothetical protein